jgi:hypothetical protein
MAKSDYKALVGLSYGEKSVEAGQVISDIPKESIAWLLAGGLITADVEIVHSLEGSDLTPTKIKENNSQATPSESLVEGE